MCVGWVLFWMWLLCLMMVVYGVCLFYYRVECCLGCWFGLLVWCVNGLCSFEDFDLKLCWLFYWSMFGVWLNECEGNWLCYSFFVLELIELICGVVWYCRFLVLKVYLYIYVVEVNKGCIVLWIILVYVGRLRCWWNYNWLYRLFVYRYLSWVIFGLLYSSVELFSLCLLWLYMKCVWILCGYL